MDLTAFLLFLDQSYIATAVRESSLLFPVLESLHVLAITAMLGTIAVVDLRLMGWASRERPVDALMDEVLPFTRWAFAAAVVTGGLMFASHATEYAHKWPFLAKMVLLLLALINILVFHRLTMRNIHTWDRTRLPFTARAGGATSLFVWIGVVATGRWIGFV